MHFYKPDEEEYSALRNEAFRAIVATAVHNLSLWQQGYGYTIQTQMFGKAAKWKQEDLQKYLPVILGVCENLLRTEMRSDYVDSEGIGWSVSPVVVTDDLIGLRENVISLLQLIFDEVKKAQQIKVIHVLTCATEFPELGQFGNDMRAMIRDNAEVIFDFYLGLLTETALPDEEVLQAIEEQVHRLRTWRQGEVKNLGTLLSVLQSYESYQLYRTLVSDAAWYCMTTGNVTTKFKRRLPTKLRK